MERTKTNRALHALTLILLSALFYCCADEHDGFNVPTGGAEKTVTFSVKVPGNSTPKNYALETADENEVKQIAVLLFTDGKYIYQPIYNNTITSTGDGTAKTFTLKVPKGTYDMVILANANASLKSVISNIQEGNSKSSVLEKITLTNTEKWNTDTNSGTYVPIPMWAEIRDITVTDGMNAVSASLLRMVAKIDVNLGPDAQKKFSLTSVRLYNYNTKGLIAPNTETDKDGNVTAKISVLGEPTKGPLLYTGDDIQKDKTTSKGISCANEIYTFEAKAGTAENLGNNTCLVIGGLYDNDKTETFYRVDFANTDAAAATYLALLRNYQYKVNIQEITGQGLATEDLAFASRPVNIKASILKWDDGKFTQFAVDGQYMIGLSQGEFIFSREERDDNSGDNTLSVITDTPGGWSLQITDTEGKELPDDNKWLTTNVTESTNPKTGDDIKLRLKPNETGSSRTAIVHVKAGRLDYKVKVTQLNTLNIGIHIIAGDKEVSSLTFVSTEQECIDKKQPAAQSFAVRWAPTSSSVSSFTTNPSGTDKAFAFDTKSGNKDLSKEVTLTASPTGYTIQPQLIAPGTIANDPFYTRSSIVLYTVSDGITSAYKALTLKQSVYNAKPVVANTYLMDGGTKTFGVRSNCRFVAKIVENPSNVIVSGLSYKGDVPTIEGDGVPVSFKLVDDLTNPTLYQKFVKIEISSPDNLFNTKTIELNCVSGLIQDESNTYIVKPNGTGLLIPVARANKSDLGPNQIGANDAFTAELVWTDNSKGVASDSNIKIVKAAGKGDTGYVLVLPGSAQGNAVVAAKVGGNIIWSWHIWVSEDEPKAIGGIMDRFLGANGSAPTKTYLPVGLCYQWGRKDPFPKLYGENNQAKKQNIYNAAGARFEFHIIDSNSNNGTLAYATRNPITFITGNSSSAYDWLISRNTKLWDPKTKTVYDPCPKGWRVVPYPFFNDKTTNMNIHESAAWLENAGGWYPTAPYYTTLANPGEYKNQMYVWYSSTDGNKSRYYNVSMAEHGVGTVNSNDRSTALPVRCIQQ